MGYDQNPVVAKICIALKKVRKAEARKRWDREKLKDATLAMEYRCEVYQAVKTGGQDGKGINNRWETLKNKKSQVQKRWKEYTEELYDKNGKPIDEDILL